MYAVRTRGPVDARSVRERLDTVGSVSVRLYAYTVALLGLIVLALLTFVPSLYLYTTRGGRFSTLTNLFGLAWALMVIGLFVLWHAAPRWLVWASLGFPVYYFVLSWLITIQYWLKRRTVSSPAFARATDEN